MPTSELVNIQPIMLRSLFLRPKTVLDIGIGYGKYGVLLREYLDINQFRIFRRDWQAKIFGVEGFLGYKNGAWESYDKVYLHDFTKPENYEWYSGFDLVLMLDSLEHVERPLGDTILDYLIEHNKNVIVSCPDGDWPQGAVNGNELERHRARWHPVDFTMRGGEIIFKGICCVAHFKGHLAGGMNLTDVWKADEQ